MHRICPKCKSENVMRDFLMISTTYTCKDCGYTGAFILELEDPDYEEFLKEEHDSKKIDRI